MKSWIVLKQGANRADHGLLKMQNSHLSTTQSDRKGMFSEHSHSEQMLTAMASKSAHLSNFHLRQSDINRNNRHPSSAAAAVVDHTVGGGSGMDHLFPYDVHSSGTAAPAPLLPFNIFPIDQSKNKPTVQQQQQNGLGNGLHKTHAKPAYSFGRSPLLTTNKDKNVSEPTPTQPQPQPKPALRNPKKSAQRLSGGPLVVQVVQQIPDARSVQPEDQSDAIQVPVCRLRDQDEARPGC